MSKTSADVRKELDKVQYECADLQRRHDEIEQAIADNWNADTTDLQTEYAGIDARLKASTRVKDKLYIQWRDLFTSEQVTIFAGQAKQAKAQQTKAQELNAKADDLIQQANDLKRQAADLQGQYDGWCRQSVNVVNDLKAQGVEDVSGFIAVVNDTRVGSQLQHWEGGYSWLDAQARKKSKVG